MVTSESPKDPVTEQIRIVLDGRWAHVRQQLRADPDFPVAVPALELGLEEHRRRTLDTVRSLAGSELVRAGLPIIECLDALQAQTENPVLAEALGQALTDCARVLSSPSTVSSQLPRRPPRALLRGCRNTSRTGRTAAHRATSRRLQR